MADTGTLGLTAASAGHEPRRSVARGLKRICHVLHGLTVGGAEVLAARLGRQLRHRYQVSYVCLDELGQLGEELRSEGFRVEVLHRRPGLDLACARRLGRFFREAQIDVVHAHQYTPFFYALAARWPRRRPPILFTEHGRWFPDFPRRKRILFNRLMLARRDRVVGVGEAVRQALIHNEGLPANRVAVIYNGVDMDCPTPAGDERATVRQEMQIGLDDFVILQIARFDHLKDHATAVRTIARVAREHPRARLVFVGDGAELAATRALAREQGVEPAVRFLGLRTDAGRLLAAADLFLLTSISEGIPVTAIEAMAARLPVVATRVGGLPEVVIHEETGLLTESGDDAALARAILRLAADPKRREQMGRQGRERACRMFAEPHMHAAYCRLYDEMLLG